MHNIASNRIHIAIYILIAIICFGNLKGLGEDGKVWQSGTVIQVKGHEVSSGDNSVRKQYEITVQVGSKIYVATYTLKDGEPDLEYYVGMARMVLVDGDTLTFNDLLGHPHSLHITSSKDAPKAGAK